MAAVDSLVTTRDNLAVALASDSLAAIKLFDADSPYREWNGERACLP